MTTRSAGSTSRSAHSGGSVEVYPRGGDGSAAITFGSSSSSISLDLAVQPISACAKLTRDAHEDSAFQRVTSASSAALDSP
ncbi:Uncharacterised protein [Mycobacteroides abscessus subsp. abscessus]|nr:Uncharacterised protein [Mycobacteroides abscessus subsp. abscessus]